MPDARRQTLESHLQLAGASSQCPQRGVGRVSPRADCADEPADSLAFEQGGRSSRGFRATVIQNPSHLRHRRHLRMKRLFSG
jgi:hypothetical protein